MSAFVKLSMTASLVVNQQVVPLHVRPNLTSEDVASMIASVSKCESLCRLNLAEELRGDGIALGRNGKESTDAQAYGEALRLITVTMESSGTAFLSYAAPTTLGDLVYAVELSSKGEIIDMWSEQ